MFAFTAKTIGTYEHILRRRIFGEPRITHARTMFGFSPWNYNYDTLICCIMKFTHIAATRVRPESDNSFCQNCRRRTRIRITFMNASCVRACVRTCAHVFDALAQRTNHASAPRDCMPCICFVMLLFMRHGKRNQFHMRARLIRMCVCVLSTVASHRGAMHMPHARACLCEN